MKNRVFALICALMLLITSTSVIAFAEDSNAESGETVQNGTSLFAVGDNDKASLAVNLESSNVILTDKATGHRWMAFDEENGIDLNSTLGAIINVSYINSNGIEAVAQAPSRESSFEIYRVKNGAKIVYNFDTDATGFSVPIIVTLKDGYLETQIDYAGVKEKKGGSEITDIEVLPNLMYGKHTQNGYVFIPDGSGAVIDYADSFSRDEKYSARIYGDDSSQNLLDPKITDAKNALMPVFGAVKDNSALFAVITKGDVYATVNADMAENSVSAGCSFVYKESDLTGLQNSTGGERTLTITQDKPLKIVPTVRYYILFGENASYSGMANTYRDYLLENGSIKAKKAEETPAVSVMAYGAVPEQETVFGIPVTTLHKATTFKQLSSLYKDLTKDGSASPSFYLYGFLSGGYGGKTVTKPKYISKLGGKKGFEEFQKTVGKDNVYTVYDVQRSRGRAFDFLRFKDYMSSLNQTVVKHHYRLSSSGKWDTEKGGWSYYTIDYQKKSVSRLSKKISKDYGIVFEHYGNELLSDFTNASPSSRQEYTQFLIMALAMMKSKGANIALEGGNTCVVNKANEVYDIPLDASGFAIESYSVPFYTMVYHSYIPLSSSPVNLYNHSEALSLKAFEQGVSATFAVTGCDPYELRSTLFNFLYNSKIDNLLPAMTRYTKAYNEIHSVLADQKIVKHEYVGDLSISTYANGWRIVCNYGDIDTDFQNQTIKALGYTVLK